MMYGGTLKARITVKAMHLLCGYLIVAVNTRFDAAEPIPIGADLPRRSGSCDNMQV
jgi:hypothetical protein